MILPLTLMERLLHRLHLLPAPVMDAFAGVLFGRALAIAVRRGLFETVANDALLAQEIATKTGMSDKGVALLAKALVVGGYLVRRGEKYTVSEEGRKWLVRSSPSYIGNLIAYVETLHERWGALEYSLDHGKPRRPYFEGFIERDWEIYVHGMQDLARLLMHEVIPKVILRKDARRLLDIGGSHGLYSIECCQRYPGLEATVIDFPSALTHTAGILRTRGMETRITLLGGDFKTTDFPTGLDGILMFNIIHGLTEDENRSMVARALAALSPEGKLFILDQLQGGGRSALQQLIPLMVGLNLLNEIGGTSYGLADISRWCASARSVRQLKMRLPGVTLIEVTK